MRGINTGLIDMLADEDKGKIRRTCTELKETEGCDTIPLLPGIGLGEDTVCYCSNNLCNGKWVSTGSKMSSEICIVTYVAVVSYVLSNKLN